MRAVILAAIYGIIYIPFLVLWIIALVLSIKLMRRGIVALDKYIEENQ